MRPIFTQNMFLTFVIIRSVLVRSSFGKSGQKRAKLWEKFLVLSCSVIWPDYFVIQFIFYLQLSDTAT